MAEPVKRTVKKEEGLPAVVKYFIAAVLIVGIGYGGYMASNASRAATANLRNSCGFMGGGGGLTSFGSCR